jgi:arylsulfatase A-like enzyme
MVQLLDDSVANLTRALQKNGMLDDTLIVFTSDVIFKLKFIYLAKF